MKQAGLPDMQLMSDGTPGGLDLEQSPFHAGSLIADPNPEPSPSLPTGSYIPMPFACSSSKNHLGTVRSASLSRSSRDGIDGQTGA